MPPQTANEKKDYQIYKEIKEIYKLEWERTDKLNDKAVSVVTSSGVILAIYTGLATFTLEKVHPSNVYFPYLVTILMFSLTLLISAILLGLSAFGIAKYKVTDPADFITEYDEKSLTEFLHFYGGDLKTAILENRKTNDDKSNNIKHALYALTSATATIITYSILMLYALM